MKFQKYFISISFMALVLSGFYSTAEATKKVYSPLVHKGEWEIETRGSYDIDDDDSKDDILKQKYAVGYGLTDWWAMEFYGEFEKSSGGDYDFAELELENIFQLTEKGKYWVDFGVLLENKISFEDNSPDKVEVKFLFEKRPGPFKHRANIIFEQEVGGDSSKDLEAGLAWGSKYKWKEFLSPGFEYYIDFGEMRRGLPFDSQKHQVGPMLYGYLTDEIEYKIGYLFGASDAAPDGSIIWELEYEWEF